MKNSIVNAATKWFENDSGKFPAVVMGLNIFDLETAEEFLKQVVETFKSQRMCSPPETSNMTFTIAGEMSADEFQKRWTEMCLKDPILAYFMSQMVLADVLHIKGRTLLGHASLLLAN